MKKRWFGVAMGALSSVVACQLVVGVRDRQLGGAPIDAGAGSDATVEASGCGDTTSDPNNCGYCGRACSPCTNGACPIETVFTLPNDMRGFALDDKRLYVLSKDGLRAYDKNAPMSAPLYQATNPLDAGVYPFHTVASGGDAYWADNDARAIFVTHASGVTEVVHRNTDTSLISALAISNGEIFWATFDHGSRRVALDGGGFAELEADTPGDYNALGGIAAGDNFVFVGDLQNNLGVLHTIPKTGGAPSVRYQKRSVHAVAARGDVVYFGANDVERATLDGGPEAVSTTNGDVLALALTSDRLYAACRGLAPGTASIITAPLGGGGALTLATDQAQMGNVVIVDGEWVYWFVGWLLGDTFNVGPPQPAAIRRTRR